MAWINGQASTKYTLITDIRSRYPSTRLSSHTVIGDKVYSIVIVDSTKSAIVCSNLDGTHSEQSDAIYDATLVKWSDYYYGMMGRDIYRCQSDSLSVQCEALYFDNQYVEFAEPFTLSYEDKYIGRTRDGSILISNVEYDHNSSLRNYPFLGATLKLYNTNGELLDEFDFIPDISERAYHHIKFFLDRKDRIYFYYKVGNNAFVKRLKNVWKE